MRIKRPDILFPILYGLLIGLIIAAGGWLLACTFFSPAILTLLGGSFLIYALLFVTGLALVGGSIFLLPRLEVWKKTMQRLEMTQLKTQLDETDRVQAQTLAQLEEKQAQLEAERAEVRAIEARTAEMEAKTAARLAAVEAREAAIEEKEKRLVIDQRRLKAWKRDFQKVRAEWKAEVAEIKAHYGVQSMSELPDEVEDKLLDDIFNRSEAIDPPCFKNMFCNPFGFIEGDKPLKQPANPLHPLLEQGVAQGVITAEELEEITCPISYQVMLDPVKSTDSLGRTYDRYCLENIYFTYPGTYPFERSEMTLDPTELPRDSICYDKIQNLVKRCQAQLTLSSEATEESAHSTFGMLA